MNVLYLHTHDTGRYIQPYGYQVPTPNLMQLAQEGTLFRQAFCTGPTCSPSRAGLLTGMAPHCSGMLGLAHRGFILNDYSKHLVQFMKNNSYETVLCGIQHEAPDAEMIGYNKVLRDQDYHMGKGDGKDWSVWDLKNATHVAEYIKQNNDRPFFLSYGMFNTHREFPKTDASINPDYVMPPFPLYDTADNRKDMAGYISSAMVMDRCIGIVLDALKESACADDTIIIFTTDHGIAFPKMKCNLYDTGIGVSLIIKYPGNKKAGKAVDSLVSHLDIFPTICELLSNDKPAWLQGNSLMPLLQGDTEKVRDEIFSEVSFHAAYEPMRCIRTERYKLITFFDVHDKILPSNIDDSLSKEFLTQYDYLDEVREKELLFDLYLDPVERINRVNDASYKEVYVDLRERLNKWMMSTNDPLWSGKIKKPEGAVVNKLSCYSPRTEDYE